MVELQKIDCNCNDCFFMQRNLDRFNQSLEFHKRVQLNYFNAETERMDKNMLEKWNKGDDANATKIYKQLLKREFRFEKAVAKISFGNCSKLNKDVAFVPNTLQLETQQCFKHRKDG